MNGYAKVAIAATGLTAAAIPLSYATYHADRRDWGHFNKADAGPVVTVGSAILGGIATMAVANLSGMSFNSRGTALAIVGSMAAITGASMLAGKLGWDHGWDEWAEKGYPGSGAPFDYSPPSGMRPA